MSRKNMKSYVRAGFYAGNCVKPAESFAKGRQII
jgi:hypothetical protein